MEDAVERRALAGRRLQWLQPGAAQSRTGDCLLHRHGQHAPPTPRPTGSRRRAHGWRGAVRPEAHQVLHEAAGLGVPAAPHLGAEHNQRLGPCPAEFWVARLRRSATRSTAPSTAAAHGRIARGQGEAVGAPLVTAGTQAWRRSTALRRCSAPRTRRGRVCDGPAFRHAGRWCGPTTAAEGLALPTPSHLSRTSTQHASCRRHCHLKLPATRCPPLDLNTRPGTTCSMEKSRVRSSKTSPRLTTLVAGNVPRPPSMASASEPFCGKWMPPPPPCLTHRQDRSQSPLFRAFLLRRLRLPLPLTAARRRCRQPHGAFGNHLAAAACAHCARMGRTAARVCREAGATVVMHVLYTLSQCGPCPPRRERHRNHCERPALVGRCAACR